MPAGPGRTRTLFLALFLLVFQAGCAMTNGENGEKEATSVFDPQTMGGPWFVEYIGERPVIDRSPAHIQFGADGRVSGNASCNQFTGGYEADGERMQFGNLATTLRACIEALSEQEQRFLQTIDLVAKWRIEQGLLVLTDESGSELFRAATHAAPQVTGSAAYRERIALPPAGVVFTATLLDVSRMDVAADTIASAVIENPGQVPIDFAIDYDPGKIDAGMTYAVRATLHVDGKLWATSDTHHPVLTRGAGRDVDILLKLIR